MAIAPLIVQVRATGTTALASTAAQLRALGTTAQGLTRTWTQHTRAVSSVRRAYRDANGLWRNANGTLLTQRHTVTQVTTAYGRLARAVNATGRAMRTLSVNTLRGVGNGLQGIGMALLRLAGTLSAILPFVFQLGGLLATLAPLLMYLAPAAFAAGASLLALKLGLNGVGDALKAGLSGDVDEFNKALKKLSPSAAGFVKELVRIAPLWRDLRTLVQEKLFVGLAGEVEKVSNALGPLAATILPRIASSFNRFFLAIAKGLQSPEFARQIEVIFEGVSNFIDGLLHAVRMLGRALLDIAEVAAPGFGRLGSSIGIAADKFATWIREMKDSGKLKEWLDKAKETFDKIKEIGAELGRIFKAIFKGTDGSGFLDNLKKSLSDLADWLEGDDGQSVIKFFSDVAKAAAGLISTIAAVVRWFQEGVEILRDLGDDLKKWLSEAFGAIGSAASALFAVISGGQNAFGWIGAVAGRLASLVATVRGAVGAINAALATIRTSVNIDIYTRNHGVQGYAKPIGGGRGGGAPKFMAAGGTVAAGQAYIVGEKRPELFVPNSSGRIVPSLDGLGGGGIHITITGGVGGNPMVDAVLQMFHRGQLKLKVDRSNRVVPT